MNWKKAETNCSEIPNNSDTIYRQAAIDALDKRFNSIPMEQTTEILLLRKDLRNLPSAQPEERAETHSCDCISRQAAIEVAKQYWYKPDIAGALAELPSAQTKQKVGHWIDNHNGTISCSYCHVWFYKNDRYSYMRYCPYCNAKMEGEDGKSGCNHPVGEDKDPDHE